MHTETQDNTRHPTELNTQQINYAIRAAVPALITVVDQRVEQVLGAAVTTIEAAANRLEEASQKTPRKSNNRRPVIPDEYDGDIEARPARRV
jgi:hypothetical protein